MQRTRTLAILLTATVAATTLARAAAADDPTKVTAVEGITEYRLANGMQVLLFPDQSRPTVTVNITVFVGSRHEGYGETGMAHLLEHMLFKGTPMHRDIDKMMTQRGATFNGSTWVDRTNYFETLAASDDNLEFAIRLEADRLVNSFVKREDLDSEMTVVRNEFEMGENSPSNILEQRMLAVAYEWHNYGKSTIGNRTDIERVPIDALRRFYRRYYRPDNAMLVVAGKFDEKKALAFIQKYCGALSKPKEGIERTYTEEPAQDGERVVVLRRVGEVAHVGVAYHIPAGSHGDFPPMEILEDILTARPSGILYQALVETKKAARVNGSAYAWHDPAVLLVTAEVRKGQSLDEVRDILLGEIEAIGAKGVTDEQVERARKRFLKERELAAADSTRIAVQLSEWAAQGDWRLYFLHRDRMEKVSAADVQRVAASYLRTNNRTVGMYIPTGKPTRTHVPPSPNIASALKDYKGRATIAMGEVFDPTPENIDARTRRQTLPEGIKLALVPKKNRGESVVLELKLRYGDEKNLKGLTTACTMLPELMSRATRQMSRQQLQDALDANRTNLNASGAVGEATFVVRTQRAYLPKALELLAQILREPALPASELEIVRRQRLVQLERMSKEPNGVAINLVQRALSPYPPDDVRHVPTIDAGIKRVQSVTIEQLERLHRDYLGNHAGELIAVGDFEPSDVVAAVSTALADWKATAAYARIERPVAPGIQAGRNVLETPDKANAIYLGGYAFPMKDDHADFPALAIASHILGGTFSSRLVTRVRQKEGLSYGVGCQLNSDAVDTRSTMQVFAICNPENMPKVERAIREELDRLVREGVTADELKDATSGFLKELQVARGDDGQLLNMLQEHVYADRTMAFEANLEKKIRTLRIEEVNEAIRRHVAPGKLVIAVAGDFAKKSADKPAKEPNGKPASK